MALFKTTTDLQGFHPARLTLKFEDILPFLEQVEHEYLRELVLGPGLYDELHSNYQAGTMSQEHVDLLPLARAPVVPLAIVAAAHTLNVQLTSGGFVVAVGEKLSVASESRIENLKREQLAIGHKALDRLVDHCFENNEDLGWFASDQFTDFTQGFVTTTREFQKWVPAIGNSGFLYLRMRPTIRTAEQEDIRAVLCDVDLYVQLLAEASAGDQWTGQNGALALYIRPAVCHLSIARAISSLALTLGPEGMLTLGSASHQGGPNLERTAANEKRLDTFQKHHESEGLRYLDRLRAKCQELAEAGQLSLYLNSDCYVDPTAEDPNARDPEDSIGNFL